LILIVNNLAIIHINVIHVIIESYKTSYEKFGAPKGASYIYPVKRNN